MEKNYIEYRYKVEELFFKYLKDNDLDFLIKKLYEIEENIREEAFNGFDADTGMWFRFFDSDTLATTIGNIKADLSMPPNHPNHELLINNMKLVIGLNGEMKIYFS